MLLKWGLPKIRGTFFWGPYNADPTVGGNYYIGGALLSETRK